MKSYTRIYIIYVNKKKKLTRLDIRLDGINFTCITINLCFSRLYCQFLSACYMGIVIYVLISLSISQYVLSHGGFLWRLRSRSLLCREGAGRGFFIFSNPRLSLIPSSRKSIFPLSPTHERTPKLPTTYIPWLRCWSLLPSLQNYPLVFSFFRWVSWRAKDYKDFNYFRHR